MNGRYVLCPGYVKSQSDGDMHYVGASDLARLYGLHQKQWVRLTPHYRKQPTDVLLYPRTDGNYTLPGDNK